MKGFLKVAKPYDEVVLEFLLSKDAKKVYVSEKDIMDRIADELGEVEKGQLEKALMKMEIRGLITVTSKDSTKLVALAEG
ncbi:MAG: hypothetical protein RXR41_00125 [Candidatus Marsarchaeota archaeon]|jgi:DNA-binding PadR family transcriptional regulator